MKKTVLTVSSANMDFVMTVQKVPVGGQTLIDDGSYHYYPGGKGANSAVAISRLGGASVFCTRLGNDDNGTALRRLYAREKIDTRYIVTDPEAATGLGCIMVEPNGQNRIIVFPGANRRITSEDVDNAMECRPDALFMQLEITPEAILYAAKAAAARGIPIFMDAGPADASFPLEGLPELEVFSPNETECEIFTGIRPSNADQCLRAAITLSHRVKAKYYVLKLGDRGCYVYDGKYYYCLPAYDTRVVDTTAAGDSFTAALTLEYLRSGDIVRAGKYANAVGAIAVSIEGALPSIPTEHAVEAFLAARGIEL